MRIAIMFGLLLVCSSLQAQTQGTTGAQPGQQQPAQQQQSAAQPVMTPEQKAALEGILQSWESDAKGLQSLLVQFKVSEKDPTFNKTTVSFGEAKVLKMPTGQYGLKLEIFELDKNGNPDPKKIKRKYVCSGVWFYNFDIAAKTIWVQQLQNQNVRPDDGPFAFLFGMKAVDARKRFDMNIVQSDQNYNWIRVVPLTDQDRRDFTIAQLGVVKFANQISPKDFPLTIQWREPGKAEITWEFKAVVRNDGKLVNLTEFNVEAEKKAGWQIRQAPTQASLPATPPGNGVQPAGANVPRK
ncbi:MAG: hypothetical protein JNJ77_20710 [Planctomycetia bacterium]|nr:hypothetical protein [Planctomycetia bacterium]